MTDEVEITPCGRCSRCRKVDYLKRKRTHAVALIKAPHGFIDIAINDEVPRPVRVYANEPEELNELIEMIDGTVSAINQQIARKGHGQDRRRMQRSRFMERKRV